jgi:SAM-dependent methyltransferase
MHCPICDTATQQLFEKHGYPIHGCPHCGHCCAALAETAGHVGRIYGDHYFHGHDAGYPDYLSEGPLLRNHGRRYARLLRRFTSPGTLLDVGAAAGFILRGFCDLGWQGRGLEPNEAMAAHARTVLHVDVQTGDLENWRPAAQFTLVSMIQVVAHFHDLRRAFRTAADATQPGGFWLIETWNRASLSAMLFGRHWHEYSPPSVLHWFTPRSLRQLARQFGLRQIAQGRPRKMLGGAHAKLLLRPRLEALPCGSWLAPFANFIPDRAEILYPAEDLFWAVFQKQ